MRHKLWYYARRPTNDLLPFRASLADAADDKAPPGLSARSVTYTRTLLLRTLSESLAELHETKERASKKLISWIVIGQRALNEIVPLLEATDKFSYRRACLAYLTVRQRVCALALSFVPSIIGALLSVRSSACPASTFGKVSVLALFHSRSGKLLVWLGQGHLLCSICMPWDVPRFWLGGVRALGLTPQELWLSVAVEGAGLGRLLFVFLETFIFRASRAMLRCPGTRIYSRAYTFIQPKGSPGFALPDSGLLYITLS